MHNSKTFSFLDAFPFLQTHAIRIDMYRFSEVFAAAKEVFQDYLLEDINYCSE
jgi:hypothetical protein